VRQDRVATFLLKKSPFTAQEIAYLQQTSDRLGFDLVYAPGVGAAPSQTHWIDGTSTNEYAQLIRSADPEAFYRSYRQDIRPTTDDRPFFFHTTKLKDQFDVAFGKSMLFGNGLSALMTLLGISTALVALFVLGPLLLTLRE